MPTLPTYNAQQNINARPAAPVRDEAAQPFKDQQKIISIMADITQKWSDVNDTMQYTKAKASHATAIASIESQAAVDPNYNNSEKYQKDLEKANSDSISMISNQQVASKASIEFAHDSEVAQWKINNNFKKKQIKENEFTSQGYLDGLYQQRAIVSPNEQTSIDNKIQEHLNLQLSKGLISPVELQKQVEKAKVSGASQEILSNPSSAIEHLRDEKGPYADLPPEKKLSLERTAIEYKNKLEKEKEAALKEAKFDNESNVVLEMAKTGKIPSTTELSNMVLAGTMDADFVNNLIEANVSPKTVLAKTDGKIYSALTEEIYKSDDKDKQREVIKKILKGGGDGKISNDDMQVLFQAAVSQGNQAKEEVSKTIDSLGSYAIESGLPKHEIYRTFVSQVMDGKSINEASDYAKKKVIKDNIPGAATLDDVPTAIVGKDNKTRFIFPQSTTISAHKIWQPEKKAKE